MSLIARRTEIVRSFRGTVDGEHDGWQDIKYAEIRERHLAPLIAANDRFNAELEAIDANVRAALRRLEQTR